jgi:hypothetical protein
MESNIQEDVVRKTYKIGYYSYEELHYFEYTHKKEFSKSELSAIVYACLRVACQKLMNEYSQSELLQNSPYNVSFEDMFEDELFYEEMKNKGFERVNYTAEIAVFGWASPTKKLDNQVRDDTAIIHEMFDKEGQDSTE